MSNRQRIERDVADIRTPVTDGVAAPASKDPGTLPFRERSWQDFERILLQYAEHIDGLRSVRIYGLPGQAQNGIDLYGIDPAGTAVAYQAKNVERFTDASLRAAVTKFCDEPPAALAIGRLVVCTACRTDDTKLGDELASQRMVHPGLVIDLYDERTLSEGLRARPDLVRRLFGPAWQVTFCDNAAWEVPERSSLDSLADLLVRGPLVALGLLDDLNRANATANTAPADAAQTLEHIIEKVNTAGFRGMTVRLQHRRAELLIDAGRIDEAASALGELAWANRTSAEVDGDPHATFRLRKLANSHDLAEAGALVDAIDAVDSWHRVPQPQVDRITTLALQLDAAGHSLGTHLILWAAETAVTERRTMREGPLIDTVLAAIAKRAPVGLGDELNVRLRTAAADLGGDWTELLRDARAGRLGPRMATLVHARYGRYLYLRAEPEDAQVEYSAAVQSGCQAQLGNEAADALSSLAQMRARYGPVTEDLGMLPGMAIDLRRQGHISQLLPGRHPADAGAAALAAGKVRPALQRYRAAVRHAVIRGDAAGELNAHHYLAEILLQVGEPIASIPHIVRNGTQDHTKRLSIDRYVDLRREVLEGPHWERATAFSVLTIESDLVPDGHLEDYVTVALAATSEPRRSVYGPHVSLTAWKAIASLAGRLGADKAETVLSLLADYMPRDPGTSRHTDDDHIAAVARIYATHASLVAPAVEQLSRLVLLDLQHAETVRFAIQRSVANPRELLDALRPHASCHEGVARILSDYGEYTEEALKPAAQQIELLVASAAPAPQDFTVGTDLPNLAQQARGLDGETRGRFIEYCMALAEDGARPSFDRSEGMEGVLLLARSVDETTRTALFDRALALARLDLPPTPVDSRLTSSNHPLSPININLDNGALPRGALTASALLAVSPEQAQAVLDRSMTWLTGDEQALEAVAHSLHVIDSAQVTINLEVLRTHPSHCLRQLSVVLAARSVPAAGAVLRPLVRDSDRRVRREIAQILPEIAASDEHLANELREVLRADPSWMVRSAAAGLTTSE